MQDDIIKAAITREHTAEGDTELLSTVLLNTAHRLLVHLPRVHRCTARRLEGMLLRPYIMEDMGTSLVRSSRQDAER